MGKRGKKEKNQKKQKGKRQQNPFENNKGRKGRGKGRTKQDKNWDKYFKEFQTFLEPRGVYMRDVEGDGNCLFRSIADHVDGDESQHEQYREKAVEYITEHKDYFAMFLLDDENIDEYIKDMTESGTWGGHFELVALSALLKAKFCLHIKDKDPVIIKSSEMDLKGTKIIHLAYHVDEHYSSIRKLGDDAKAPAEAIAIQIDDDSTSDSSEDDSTEGSDKEMSRVTEEVEKLHLQDKKNKKKGKDAEEEQKSNSKPNNKPQKNKDRKEDKNKNQKRKGR